MQKLSPTTRPTTRELPVGAVSPVNALPVTNDVESGLPVSKSGLPVSTDVESSLPVSGALEDVSPKRGALVGRA